ncbi:cupin domain-containing protein [Nannocystis bainbridge]|uniref:Cupin domain-containing protein n=1 Tax=Nannocystis bainbridge TaxID=2995303 RepID=A0ABT5DX39_9BACT|nr:cupin domain-containing protein [Nannocystis bainbridge]MDC0717669.1 cupin domain-containing protein [Nannocystis bainbridge]
MSIRTGDADAVDGAIAEAFTALSLALKPVRPTAAMRARLLAAVTAPERRFSPFIGRLARLLDLAEARVRELLDRLTDRAAWENVLPDVELFHLEGGPATAGADVGFVRVAAGARFPHHNHLGDEHVLVLQGGFVEDDGTVVRAGASSHCGPGSSHSLTALPDQDLVYAVVVFGVEFPGLPPRP